MKDISLHIMDIVENGIGAEANLIKILVDEQRDNNMLLITIEDNGRGIPEDVMNKVTDPFFTSRTTRRVGLGLSLLKAASERCSGQFDLTSTPGKGTRVSATFEYNHIDRAPIGDTANAIGILMMGNQDIDIIYKHIINGNEFELDTREIKKELDDVPLSEPAVIQHLVKTMGDAVNNL